MAWFGCQVWQFCHVPPAATSGMPELAKNVLARLHFLLLRPNGRRQHACDPSSLVWRSVAFLMLTRCPSSLMALRTTCTWGRLVGVQHHCVAMPALKLLPRGVACGPTSGRAGRQGVEARLGRNSPEVEAQSSMLLPDSSMQLIS